MQINLPEAPNFNFNVSHEGHFVVLASEPHTVCGVDCAAPSQLRRGKPQTMDDIYKVRPFPLPHSPSECTHARVVRSTCTPADGGGVSTWGQTLGTRLAQARVHARHHRSPVALDRGNEKGGGFFAESVCVRFGMRGEG